jgi:hypothetical protein
MIKPFQIVVNLAVLCFLGFTHWQVFQLGRASADNIFSRWMTGNFSSPEQCTQTEQKPEKSWFEKFLEGQTNK